MMKKYVINSEKALLKILSYKLKNGQDNGISFDEYQKFILSLKYNIDFNTQYEDKVAFYNNISFGLILMNAKKYLGSRSINPDLYYSNGMIKVGYDLREICDDDTSIFSGYMEKIVDKTLSEVINSHKNFSNETINLSPLNTSICATIVDNILNEYINSNIRLGNWPINCTDIDEYVLKRNIGPLIDLKLSRDVYIKLCINALKSINKQLNREKDVSYFSNNPSNLLAFSNYIGIFDSPDLEFLKRYIYYPKNIGKKEINIGVFDGKAILVENVLTNVSYFGEYKYYKDTSIIDESKGNKIKRIITTYK